MPVAAHKNIVFTISETTLNRVRPTPLPACSRRGNRNSRLTNSCDKHLHVCTSFMNDCRGTVWLQTQVFHPITTPDSAESRYRTYPGAPKPRQHTENQHRTDSATIAEALGAYQQSIVARNYASSHVTVRIPALRCKDRCDQPKDCAQ